MKREVLRKDCTKRSLRVLAQIAEEENHQLREALHAIRCVVDLQADDEDLWFPSGAHAEGYLESELYRLHEVVVKRTDAVMVK